MKKIPFDLEKAKAGAKLVTKDGKPVRIVCWNRLGTNYSILALVKDAGYEREEPFSYTIDGKFLLDKDESHNDLFILEESDVRPYSNAEEMDAAIKKHGIFIENKFGRRLAITGYDDYELSVGTGKTINYRVFLETYKWLDNSSCGVEEGGNNE